MQRAIGVALAVLTVLVVAAPGVSAHGTTAPASRPGPVPTLSTDAIVVPAGSGPVALSAGQTVELTLGLSLPDPSGLDVFLEAVENPSSPEYRHFLTSSQFESRFAPSPASASAAAAALAEAGARFVTIAPDRLSVSGAMSAAEVDRFLGVTMVGWSGDGGMLQFTAIGTPSLPPALVGRVSSIDGLSNSADFRLTDDLAAGPLARVPSRGSGVGQFAIDNASGQQWYVGSDFANTFGVLGLLPGSSSSIANATYPTGVAVATLLASGYNQTLSENTPPWDPTVVRTYLNDTLAPAQVNVSNRSALVGVPVTISGITPPAPGPFGNVNDSTLDEFENSLDLEMAGSLAPGAPLYNFYFAGSLLNSAPTDADVAAYFDQDLASALSYNYSPAQLGVITCSFGISDLNDSVWDSELQQAAAMGVTVVAASGDQGDAPDHLTGRDDGQWPIWPATAAFNTSGSVSVGGVSIGLDGGGAGWFNGSDLYVTYDSNTTGLTGLSTWWDTLGGAGSYAGSEGGVSTVYAEPYWQYHSAAQPAIVNATELQGASSIGRAGPDVAFPANATIAFVFADAQENIYFTVLEGTSIAAPAFAGLLADEIAVGHHLFGYLDPELYRIGSYFAAHATPPSAFLDVITGGNYVFAAGPGWDATTGWGVPLGPELYQADLNATIRDYVYTGPTPNLPPVPPAPPVPWTEILLVFGIGLTVAVVLVILVARPTERTLPPPAPPFGATAPPPPPSSSLSGVPPAPGTSATFLCPYCGAPRPAEPVRCPKCGAL
jgi:subtilase family serine protease